MDHLHCPCLWACLRPARGHRDKGRGTYSIWIYICDMSDFWREPTAEADRCCQCGSSQDCQTARQSCLTTLVSDWLKYRRPREPIQQLGDSQEGAAVPQQDGGLSYICRWIKCQSSWSSEQCATLPQTQGLGNLDG